MLECDVHGLRKWSYHGSAVTVIHCLNGADGSPLPQWGRWHIKYCRVGMGFERLKRVLRV